MSRHAVGRGEELRVIAHLLCHVRLRELHAHELRLAVQWDARLMEAPMSVLADAFDLQIRTRIEDGLAVLTAGLLRVGRVSLEEMEKALIRHTLAALSGNRTRTAATLGISRATLLRKIKTYALE